MTKEFLMQVLSVPNPSGKEDLMRECVQTWAKGCGVKYKEDGRGNVYLTKGRAEIYPCVTSHLDSVINGVDDYIRDGKPLDVREEGNKIVAYAHDKRTVLGADCKAGIAICLSIMERAKACKCTLYVEEERGSVGCRASDFSFYDDVSFVIGFDSPELNRAAYASNGTKLFDKAFEDVLYPICRKHGVNNFRSEPLTDVKFVRENTKLACFNTGNGGYMLHSDGEYCIYADTQKAEDMGYDIVTSIPTDRRWTSDIEEEDPFEWRRQMMKDMPPPPPGWRPGPPPWKDRRRWSRARNDPRQREFWADEEPGFKPPKHDDDEQCALALMFPKGDEKKKYEFADIIEKYEVPVDMDDDVMSNMVTVSGELRSVKRAYALFFDILNGTGYKYWPTLIMRVPDAEKRFFDVVAFDAEADAVSADTDDDIPEVPPEDLFDDVDEQGKKPGSDNKDEIDDFWNWFDNR